MTDRYDVEGVITKAPNGEFVMYSDYLAAITELEERLIALRHMMDCIMERLAE